MNKTGIRGFAIQARKDLIKGVSLKAFDLGITKDTIEQNKVQSSDVFVVHGRVLSSREKKQRESLLQAIHHKGYTQVIEEVAYTWFNRFCALRYMEVNHYLPSRVRVFTNTENAFKPEILKEVLHLDWSNLDRTEVLRLLDLNHEDQLYCYLLITQCNDMHRYLPGIFEELDDYTEALLPEGLLNTGSVLDQMLTQIPEEDWKEQVEIIGWLYQFYNTEIKDETYALLKKNVKVTKERVPSVTQLFTPDWIVRYMVENSLGRLWTEGHSRSQLKANWTYYLEEAKQEPEVEAQLLKIRQEYQKLNPEDIKFIDPCMGSGHILVYAFDVFMVIYTENGYTEAEAARKILEHNLYGLDIDDRAYQLAYFALMMRARKHDPRLFLRNLHPNVYAIQESNPIDDELIQYIANDNRILENDIQTIVDTFRDAKEYGSILKVKPLRFEALKQRVEEIKLAQESDSFSISLREQALELFAPLLHQAEVLAQKYDVSVTNPPYMGSSGMSTKLSDYVKKHYPDSKADLFAVFMEQCTDIIKPNRYQGMITMHSWMFLSSFESLRKKLLNQTIINMAHLGPRAFDEIGGEVVQATTYVISKGKNPDYLAKYKRLVDYGSEDEKRIQFQVPGNEHIKKSAVYSVIPGSPIAYWASTKIVEIFKNEKALTKFASPKQGLATTENKRFLRVWSEVNFLDIMYNANNNSNHLSGKWFPYNKGGEFRKWFGNQSFIVNYENDGLEIKKSVMEKYPYLSSPGFVVKNTEYYFRECISWSLISSSSIAFRYFQSGFIFDVSGMSCFSEQKDTLLYLLAISNTKITKKMLTMLAPTINFQVGDISNLPVKIDLKEKSSVIKITDTNVEISKTDWDSFETSWDFKNHPMILHKGSTAESSYENWKQFTTE